MNGEDFYELQKEALYWEQCYSRAAAWDEEKLREWKENKEMNEERLIEESLDAVKEVIGQSEHNEVLNAGTLQRLIAIVGRIESEVEEGEES